MPTWINRQYGITGLLYWSTGGMHVPSPWHDPSFRMQFNGSGSLFYPGTPCGIRGPVASMRLKNIRDGMEDYEYFALLERRAGAAAVRKVVDRIAPTWWSVTNETATYSGPVTLTMPRRYPNFDPDTVRGRINATLRYLKTNWPDAQIVLMTPLRRDTADSPS